MPSYNLKKKLPWARPLIERSLFVHGDKSPPSRFQFNAFLGKTLLTINHTSSANKSHYLRIGGENWYRMKIQLPGLWKSSAFLYIKYIKKRLWSKRWVIFFLLFISYLELVKIVRSPIVYKAFLKIETCTLDYKCTLE